MPRACRSGASLGSISPGANNRDWHHLIDLCAITQTLLVDADGIYDPRQLNDRLLLGLKGSLAEFELGLLRQRARESFEQKVRRGHILWEPPVGFIRNEDQQIEKSPDRQVQEAITGLFRKFRELGTARQAMLWYCNEQVLLPEAVVGTAGREIRWQLPSRQRIGVMLKNPCYAGAFAYGRTTAHAVVRDGQAQAPRTTQEAHGTVDGLDFGPPFRVHQLAGVPGESAVAGGESDHGLGLCDRTCS